MVKVLTGKPEYFSLTGNELVELYSRDPVDKFFKMKFQYDQQYGWNQVPTSDKINIFKEGGFREALESCSGNVWNDFLNNTCFYDNLTHSVMNKTDVTDFLYRYMEYWLTSREEAVKQGFINEWNKFSFDPEPILNIPHDMKMALLNEMDKLATLISDYNIAQFIFDMFQVLQTIIGGLFL